MSTEFELDGVRYRIGQLTAFQQFHVSRRIAPLLPPLVPIFMSIAKESAKLGGKKDAGVNLDSIAGLLQPFADSLADLSDEAAEYVLGTCMGVVQRLAASTPNETWVPVWSANAKRVMFDDIADIGKMLQITVRVLQSALGPFLAASLTSPNDAAPKAATG